jgi:hypothetical protein
MPCQPLLWDDNGKAQAPANRRTVFVDDRTRARNGQIPWQSLVVSPSVVSLACAGDRDLVGPQSDYPAVITLAPTLMSVFFT